MSTDDKLDKLLEDLAVVRTVTQSNTHKLNELDGRLQPVFAHVSSMQFVFRAIGGAVGVGVFIVSLIALFK